MGKRIKFGMLLGAGMLLVGAVLFLSGYAAGGKAYLTKTDLNKMSGNTGLREGENAFVLEKTKLEELNGLSVDLDFIDFLVKPSEDENFYLSYEVQGENGKNPLEYRVESGVLEVKEKGSRFFGIHVDVGGLQDMLVGKEKSEKRNEVIVYVPKEFIFADCHVMLADGDMKAEGLLCEKADLELSYGNLEIKDASFSGGRMVLSDGDIQAEAASFHGMELKLSYGDFLGTDSSICEGSLYLSDGNAELKHTELKNMDMELSYGNLILENMRMEDCRAVLGDGDMKAASVGFLGENKVEGSYGDVSIQTRKGEAEAMALRLCTEYGDIEVADGLSGSLSEKGDRQRFERTVESSGTILEISLTDGDISLR